MKPKYQNISSKSQNLADTQLLKAFVVVPCSLNLTQSLHVEARLFVDLHRKDSVIFPREGFGLGFRFRYEAACAHPFQLKMSRRRWEYDADELVHETTGEWRVTWRGRDCRNGVP